jgi:hypothetical protein
MEKERDSLGQGLVAMGIDGIGYLSNRLCYLN